jgi:hypothetical protein
MTALPNPSQDPGPRPSDILFLILSGALLLASAFTLGGLAAHPFAG